MSQNSQNVQTGIVAVIEGVEEEDSGSSMSQPSAILENSCFSAFSDMNDIFQVGNRLMVCF